MLVFKMLTYVEYAAVSHTSQALKILFYTITAITATAFYFLADKK